MIDRPRLCLFCEKRPGENRYGLCGKCAASRNIRRLYLRRRGWTPVWEQHLLQLTERAKRRLPLFD